MGEEAFKAIKDWMTKESDDNGKMVEKFRRVEWP